MALGTLNRSARAWRATCARKDGQNDRQRDRERGKRRTAFHSKKSLLFAETNFQRLEKSRGPVLSIGLVHRTNIVIDLFCHVVEFLSVHIGCQLDEEGVIECLILIIRGNTVIDQHLLSPWQCLENYPKHLLFCPFLAEVIQECSSTITE